MSDEFNEEAAEASAESNLSSVLNRLRRTTASRDQDLSDANSIGRYNVLGEVGRGGMGAIYKVRDEELRRALDEAPKAGLQRYYENPEMPVEQAFGGVLEFLQEARTVVTESD